MRTRFLGLAVLAMAGALAAAPANADNTPITVHVRIEGKTKTLFDGKVKTHGHKIDAGDGTGPHKCNGTNAGAHRSARRKKPAPQAGSSSTATGIRTPVSAVRGRRPNPLDDGG